MRSDSNSSKDENALLNQYGPLIGGKDLVKVLGFKTSAALRQAIRENRIAINTFNLDGRRGRYAFTAEVEKWLNSLKK